MGPGCPASSVRDLFVATTIVVQYYDRRLITKGTPMDAIDVPVLIVGGGGAGLTASALLSGLGVETLLVNAARTTSTLPKAHVLNQRAMEILTDTGAAAEIYRLGTPPEQM